MTATDREVGASRPRWFHSSTIAARKATNGRTTATRLAIALGAGHGIGAYDANGQLVLVLGNV